MEEDAAEEIGGILNGMGDGSAEVEATGISGILTATTVLDPVTVSRGIREMLADEPWTIRYCLRVIPIQEVVRTELSEITRAATELSRLIPEDATYMVLVEKRNTSISSREIISDVARTIKNSVSLEHPDRIVLIEILGATTGISVIRGADIFSAEKTRRSRTAPG